MRPVLALLGSALWLASGSAVGQEASDEYLVFFLNGKALCAVGQLEVDGKSARITRTDGTLVSYPVHLIDLVETERNRQLNFGCAKVIEVGERPHARRASPTPTPAVGARPLLVPGADAESAGDLEQTSALPEITLREEAYSDPRVVAAFEQTLDARRIFLYQTSAGSQPEYLFIRATTDSQREVFSTLTAVTDAFTMVGKAASVAVPAVVELEMVRTSGSQAGVFRIFPDMARTLASGQISVEEFYFRHVRF